MSDAVSEEVPPRPNEILDDERVQYQAMTDLSDGEYAKLAADIRENGVLQPIIVDDTETQTIIDGHHREAIASHYDLPQSKQPAYIILTGRDDEEKLSRAIKQNLIGRDSTESVKSHAVKQYIETAWDRTDDGALMRPATDSEVAAKLGVSQQLVSKVIKNTTDSIIYHDRIQAREYYEDNPNASYREVARQVDASQPTVTEWLKEDFDEGGDQEKDDEQEALFTRTDDEADKATEIAQKATSDDTEDKVGESAEEAIDELKSRDTTASSAYEDVEQTEKEVEEEKQRQQRETEREQSFSESDTTVETFHAEFTDILAEYDGTIDHIITDPPYDEDAIELWESLGEIAADVLPDGGFLIAYSGKAHLPEIHAVLTDSLNYYWQGVVRHNGPGAKIFSRKLRTGYKPILIYQKGDLAAQESFVSDVIEGTGREKDDHDWQQAEGEAAELLERFTAIDDTVCDPMCGSGTVGVACQRLQRRSVLIDNDADAIATTRRKCGVDSDE